MNNIISSASKLVLLYVVGILGLIGAFAAIWGITQGTLDPKEITSLFGTALTFVLGFYFGSKGEPSVTMAGK